MEKAKSNMNATWFMMISEALTAKSVWGMNSCKLTDFISILIHSLMPSSQDDATKRRKIING